MPIVEKNNNLSDNFESYENKKLVLKEVDIEKDAIDLISKSSDIGNHARNILSGYTP